jgi:hypothetical protein
MYLKLLWLVLFVCALGISTASEAQQRTCSGLRQACLTRCNEMRRMTTETCIATCGGYHSACMKTGEWNAAMSQYTGVKRQ